MYLLETYTHNIFTNEHDQTPLERNWESLRTELIDLTDYRIDTSRDKWYQEVYMFYKLDIESFIPTHPSDVNRLPKGIVAETFFLNGCRLRGLRCNSCSGDEDVMGADFNISCGNETRFFDVSVDTSKRGLMSKVREGRFPTLFIPWEEAKSSNGYLRSYAERYLRYGIFNTNEYFSNILSSNYIVLDHIKRMFWKNQEDCGRVFGKKGINFSKAGIQYIRSLEGTLRLLRKGI